MESGPSKERILVSLSPPPLGFLKFDINCAARGKPGLVGIGGVLHDGKAEVLFQFSKNADVEDPNEVEVMAI